MSKWIFAWMALGLRGQEIVYPDFAAPAGLRMAGSAAVRKAALRLTPSKQMERGAAWRMDKAAVRDGFETTFRFRITDRKGLGPGADGFAFVVQNNGAAALAGRGASGGFAFGHSARDRNQHGIENSLAVFFDTFQNTGDASDNSIAICTNGAKGQTRWPPPQLAINAHPPVDLKDGEAHEVRISFAPPVLSVFVDEQLAVRAPVDLGRMIGADGTAYVGFTASTGEGSENHDILDWRFRPRALTAAATSTISFARFDCMAAKGLCTPSEAIVEESAPGRYHVILPAHLPWPARIPNPGGSPVEIRDLRGTACLGRGAESCGPPQPGALRQKTERGQTSFTLAAGDSGQNQGYYEFDAAVVKY